MVIILTEKTRLGVEIEVTITHLQRLEIRLLGKAFLGYRARDGWRQSRPFYAFRCPVHGYVEDYPHGTPRGSTVLYAREGSWRVYEWPRMRRRWLK
jgi:hypothetical protein